MFSDMSAPSITFAVVGHNEAETLERTLLAARLVARSTDRVVFVDSASTDESAEIAAWSGFDVHLAPIGKGRAMQVALDCAETDWVIFLDADITDSEHSIARVLSAAVRTAGPGVRMIIGDHTRDTAAPQSVTMGVVEPLMAALYPGRQSSFGRSALSGQRAVHRDLLGERRLPPDFGVEAYLNCLAATLPIDATRVVRIGWLEHPFKFKPFMAREVASGLLDAAQDDILISSTERPMWDDWVEVVRLVIATYTGTEAERPTYLKRLAEVSSQPLPHLLAASP